MDTETGTESQIGMYAERLKLADARVGSTFKINGRELKSGDLIKVKDFGCKKIATRRVVVVGKAGFSVCSDDDFQSAVEEGKCPVGTRYFPWGTNEVIGFAEPPGLAYGPELERDDDDRQDASFRESNRFHDDLKALGKTPDMWVVRFRINDLLPYHFSSFNEFGDAAQAAAAVTEVEVVFNPERDRWDRARLELSEADLAERESLAFKATDEASGENQRESPCPPFATFNEFGDAAQAAQAAGALPGAEVVFNPERGRDEDDRQDASSSESNRFHDDLKALGKMPDMWAVSIGGGKTWTYTNFSVAAQSAAYLRLCANPQDGRVFFNPERDRWDRARLELSEADLAERESLAFKATDEASGENQRESPTRLSCSPNMDVEVLDNSDEENLDESYAGAKLLQLGKIVFNHTGERLRIQHFAVSETEWAKIEAKAFGLAEDAVKRFFEKQDPEESEMADANKVVIGNAIKVDGDVDDNLCSLLKITTTVNDAGKVKMVSLHIPAKLDPESFQEMKKTIHSILDVYETQITGRKG